MKQQQQQPPQPPCDDDETLKTTLHASIFLYLQRRGFSKTLKYFCSEANFKNEGLEDLSLDLEEMCHKYLETCNHLGKTYKSHEQDVNVKKQTGDDIHDLSANTITKKKEKLREASDSKGSKMKNHGENLANDLTPESEIKTKEKKKKKNKSRGHGTEKVSTEATKVFSFDIASKVSDEVKTNGQASDLEVKSKRKKIKKNSDSDGHVTELVKAITDDAEENSKAMNAKERSGSDPNGEPEGKSKEKKKSKKTIGTEQVSEEVIKASKGISKDDTITEQEVKSKEKKKGRKIGDSHDVGAEQVSESVEACENNIVCESMLKSEKSKDKKKKKSRSDSGDIRKLDTEITDCRISDVQNSDENATKKEKKNAKKRKLLDTEKADSDPVEEAMLEDSKRRKTDSLGENGRKQLSEVKGVLENDVLSDKQPKPENNQVKNTLEKLITHENGSLDWKKAQKSPSVNSNQEQAKGSVEPKSVNAFRRVKDDEVTFVDERLQDNSYWAKDGAEIGYGAKAQEVLGQVRGRDFRHEKTKKKRGSYRGGQIDLQSHSVKFDYSDED